MSGAATGGAGRDDTGQPGDMTVLEHLDLVMRNLPTAVAVLDLVGGRLVLQNERLAAVWRRPLAAMIAEADLSRWTGFHTDGRQLREEDWPIARTARTGEGIEAEEVEILRGDGTRGVIRISTTPIRDGEGRLMAVAATIIDVTDQRTDERMRRFLAEASGELASSLSYGTTLQMVARLSVPEIADWCAVDILGEMGRVDRVAVEPVPETEDETASALARRCPRDLESSGGVARVLRTGQPELAADEEGRGLEAIAADAEHLALFRGLGARSVMIVPLIARGKTIGALSFVSTRAGSPYGARELEAARELAARAALAIDNARLYHEAQAASRAKSDFLAVMSHELRTPLTAIIGYAELLELGIPEPLTEPQKEQIERIEISARHLQELIEEILTVASLEAGEAKLRQQSISVRELLHRAEVIIRPLAMQKELQLEVVTPTEAAEIETDAEKLLQILLNLLSNAVKFTESGSILVTAEVHPHHVEVAVGDTGIGVDASNHERIFEPFWQVDQPTTRRAGGTGLGLTISRRLAELLGGEIRVRSEGGRGSEFKVRVPRRLHP